MTGKTTGLVDRNRLISALLRFQKKFPEAAQERATALEVAIDLLTPESEFCSDDVDLRPAGLQWALLVGLEGEREASRTFRLSTANRLSVVQEKLDWLFDLQADQEEEEEEEKALETVDVTHYTYYLILWSRPMSNDHSQWEIVHVPTEVLEWRAQHCESWHCYTNRVVERSPNTDGGSRRAVLFVDNTRPRARRQGTIIASVRFAPDRPAHGTLIDYAASLIVTATHLPPFDPEGVATGCSMALHEGTQ